MADPFSVLSKPLVLVQKPAEFIIMPLTREGKEDQDLGGRKILQYWPESLDTSQSSNWQSKDIPGAPLPIYQWISGSAHSISFSVVFSRDMDGEIGVDLEEDKFNVDIEAAIAWLRMLATNSYEEIDGGLVASSPPLLWLYLPNNHIGVNSAAAAATGQKSAGIYCHLDDVNVTRSNWFQSGTTRFASVALTLHETMQVAGGIAPYSRADFMELAKKYNRRPTS